MLNKPLNPWWTVGSGAVACMFGAGTIMIYAYGILFTKLMDEYGWTRAVQASTFTWFLVGSGIGLAALGWLISRFGIRVPTAIFVTIFGIAFASIGFLPPDITLFAALFFLIGIGGAACTVLPYAVAISGFFNARRGLALGIVVAGSGVGAAFLPQIAHIASEGVGWRYGFVIIGFLAAILPLIAQTFFVRTPPGVVDRGDGSSNVQPRRSASETYFRNRYFWLVFVPIMAVSVATFGGMGSLVPLFRDNGFSPETIATILSIVGVSSWIGRFFAGYLLDKIHAPYLTAAILTMAAAGLVLLLVSSSPVMACVGAICVAFAMGAEADLLTFLISRYFPLIEFSRVTSVIWVVWAWSGGVGTSLSGGSFERFASYAPAFLGFVALLLIGAVSVCLLGPYRNPVHPPGSVSAAENVQAHVGGERSNA